MKNSKFKIKNGYGVTLTSGHPEGTPEGPAQADFSSYDLIKPKVIPVQPACR